MKLLNIMIKNYKVLFRSRASAAVVVLGPLLIILLVGLAFNNSQTFAVLVGTYTPDESGLTSDFKADMVAEGYEVFNYSTEQECINRIKEGIVHICVSFPEDFQIQNNKVNNISLFVDNSRQNLVFQVIETIKGSVQSSGEDVSLELTTDLLQAIRNTQNATTTNLNSVVVLKSNADSVDSEASKITGHANSINLQTGTVDLSGVVTQLSSLQDDFDILGDYATDVEDIEETYRSYPPVDSNFSSDLDALAENLDELENESITDIDTAIFVVESASSSITELQSKISQANTAKTNIKSSATVIENQVAQTKNNLDAVKAQLEFVQAQINALTVTEAENIVNPVEVKVEDVVTSNTRLIFIFPFLLVLVIMFVSVLLSSTLIVLEKSGKSFFRNFTTSTRDETFVLSTFLTGFVLVLIQTSILMIAASIFLNSPLLGNIPVTLLTIFIATSMFVMVGMAIGYTFNTQQAANMVSISLGSIFLLLSNLILPIEAVSPALQEITKLNPYVVASEVLRKSLLFDTGFQEIQIELALLFLYSILILIIIIMTHKISKFKYLGIVTKKKKSAIQVGEGDLFEIGDKFALRTKEDLYVALVEMQDDDFDTYIATNRKEFLLWLKDGVKDPSLAKRFKKANREGMITVLDKIIDRDKLPKTKEFQKRQEEEYKREEEAKAFEPEKKVPEDKKKKKEDKKNKKDKKKKDKKKK